MIRRNEGLTTRLIDAVDDEIRKLVKHHVSDQTERIGLLKAATEYGSPIHRSIQAAVQQLDDDEFCSEVIRSEQE